MHKLLAGAWLSRVLTKDGPAKPLHQVSRIVFIYALIHLVVALFNALLRLTIHQPWLDLRGQIESALSSPQILADALKLDISEKNNPLLDFLSLVLPHSLANSQSFHVDLDEATLKGVEITLVVAGVSLIIFFLLRIAQLNAHFSQFAARVAVTFIITVEIAILLVGLSGVFWAMTTNFRLIGWPLSIWPDIAGFVLAVNRVLPVTRDNWQDVSLSNLRLDTSTVMSLQRLSDWRGLETLRQLFDPHLNTIGFLEKILTSGLKTMGRPLLVCILGALSDVAFSGAKWFIIAYLLKPLHPSFPPFKRIMIAPFVYFFTCLFIAGFFLLQLPGCTMKDSQTSLTALGTTHPEHLLFTKSLLSRSSPGIPTRLHVDVLIPTFVMEEFLHYMRRIPQTAATNLTYSNIQYPGQTTFFTATRYNRRMGVRWPFTGLPIWGQSIGGSAAVWSWPLSKGLMIEKIPHLVLDARGTGASQGTRPIDLDESEIRDFQMVANWGRYQFWSNGLLVGGGVSYDGLTSIRLAANPERTVDATIAFFAPLHPVNDLVQNNGLPCRSFIKDYSGLVKAFERAGSPLWHWFSSSTAYVPMQVKLGFLFTFRLPVAARGWEHTFKESDLAVRRANWDLKTIADQAMFSDDLIRLGDGRFISADKSGITDAHIQTIIDKKIPTYWAVGECDSTAVRRADALFKRLDHANTFHKLVIGPWGHGGRRACEIPSVGGSWACAETEIYQDAGFFVRRVTDVLTKQNGLPRLGIPPLRGNSSSIPAKTDRSTRLTYFGGRGWNESFWDPSEPVGNPLFHFSLGKEFRLVKGANKHGSKLSVSHVFAVPHTLKRDLKVHWKARDVVGLAHDVSEILMVFGSRVNQVLQTMRTIATFISSPTGIEKSLSTIKYEGNATVDWIDEVVSDRFATLGSLSRWAIVQHLLRLPTDTDHVLACSAMIRNWGDRITTVRQRLPVAAHSTVVLQSATLKKDILLSGSPQIQVPFVVLQADMRSKNIRLDTAVVAILQEEQRDGTTRLLSEGRSTISARPTGISNDLIETSLYDLSSDLSRALEFSGSSRKSDIDCWSERRQHKRQDFRVASEALSRDPDTAGVLIFLRFTMEAVNRLVSAGSKFRLTLLPEDRTNFPWESIQRKFDVNGEKVERLLRWRIPLTPNLPENGWVKLPIIS